MVKLSKKAGCTMTFEQDCRIRREIYSAGVVFQVNQCNIGTAQKKVLAK